jgi:diaminopimelate epimerase
MLALKNKNNFVTISSKGGKLKFKKVNGQMIMIGPAKNVCSGIIND